MSSLQLALLTLAGIFFALYAMAPRKPLAAITFARYVLLGIAALLIIAPYFWLIAAAFKDKTVLNEYVFFPPPGKWSISTVNFSNIRELFAPRPSLQGTVYFWQYILNSLFLSSVTVSVQLVLSSMGGYALAKYAYPGKKLVLGFMLGSMMIPGMLLLAPLYGIVVKLGLVDSYLALLLPSAVSVFGIFLFRQAMLDVPNEIIEAGGVDGCSEFQIYFRLVMPLVKPVTGAFCLVSFLGTWNTYLAPNVYLHSQSKLTLPVVLNMFIGQYEQQYGVFLAGTLLATIPPAILFFALQREFIGGLTAGAIKK